jgi:hypothetical protein
VCHTPAAASISAAGNVSLAAAILIVVMVAYLTVVPRR